MARQRAVLTAPSENQNKKLRAQVLSMLMVLSHFEEGQTNLTRHPQLLDPGHTIAFGVTALRFQGSEFRV